MITPTDTTIEDRVNTGAAWLDEHHPGWLDRIDLEILDLYNCERCVLGQMFGSYEKAPLGPPDDPTDWDDDEATALGFESVSEPYWQLTQAWRDLITARRAGGVA